MALIDILFTVVKWFWLGRMLLIDEENISWPFAVGTSGRIGWNVLGGEGLC